MCGRYVTISKLKTIEKQFNVIAPQPFNYKPSPNISIGEKAPIICSDRPESLQLATFGFTPHWAEKQTYWFNARTEGDSNKENDPKFTGSMGILKKPAFRKAIRSQRCLVVADAFIEGSQQERLNRPYVLYPNDSTRRPLAFAGVWDDWVHSETGEIIRSYAILTTAQNPLLRIIGHHRAPLVLPSDAWQDWLAVDNVPLADITSLMKPFDDSQWNAYPISSNIRSPKAKSMHLLKPCGERVKKEFDYEIHQELKLEGMGSTQGRQRRLFEDD